MKKFLLAAFGLLLLNFGCSSKSGGDGDKSPNRQPIDIVVPEDMKGKTFLSALVVVPTNFLAPAGVASVSEALGRVVLDSDTNLGLQWPKFLQSEKSCMTGAIEQWPYAGSDSSFGTLSRKILKRADAYFTVLPYDIDYFKNQDDEAQWIPEVAKMADLIARVDGEALYDASDLSIRIWRRTLTMRSLNQWIPECGAQPLDHSATYTSTAMLGLSYHIVMKISAVGPGALRMGNGDSPSFEIMFNSQAQLPEIERFLVGQKAKITLGMLQVGGDPAPFQDILNRSQCQIYALQNCRNTVKALQDEISRQQTLEEESETFHWAPLGYGFRSL